MSTNVAELVPTSASQSLREVRRGVAEAADAQLLQVVRVVDALENRGASDAVLEPVRCRLRSIHPARPLRFARLLFMPVDALIVVPSMWRPGSPFLPRNAVMVLTNAVRQAMLAGDAGQERLAAIEALISGATTENTALARRAGALLWPHAAKAMRALGTSSDTHGLLEACRADWAQAGLPANELSPIALAMCPILASAVKLHDHDHAGIVLETAALQAMQKAAGQESHRAASMLLSLLLIRVPQHAAALLAALQATNQPRAMAELAADAALGWLETETAHQEDGIAEAAPQDLRRHTALLDALAHQPGDPARRRRVSDTKTHLLNGCLRRFEASLEEQVAGKLRDLPSSLEAREASLDEMEGTARTLRRFEMEARRLGGSQRFDGAVSQACEAVTATAGLERMDQARLVEILAGPEAANRLLGTTEP